MFLRIVALMRKEFLALMKDKKSRFTIVIPPIVQLLVFGYAATYDLNNVPYAVYDEDRGAAARDLLSRFKGSTNFQEVGQLSRNADIAPLINRKGALLVVHIGPQFSRNLLTGGRAELQVIVDGRNSNTAMIALNYVRAILTRYNLEWIQRHGGTSPPAHLEIRAWYNTNLESRWFDRSRYHRFADAGGHSSGDRSERGPGARTGHIRPAVGDPPAAG